jgi:hypothetical protein
MDLNTNLNWWNGAGWLIPSVADSVLTQGTPTLGNGTNHVTAGTAAGNRSAAGTGTSSWGQSPNANQSYVTPSQVPSTYTNYLATCNTYLFIRGQPLGNGSHTLFRPRGRSDQLNRANTFICRGLVLNAIVGLLKFGLLTCT